MRRCWSEGELRAYLDRELPRNEMEAVTGHLGECAACGAALTEIRRRAEFVEDLFRVLPVPDSAGVVAPAVLVRKRSSGWRPLAWTAGALAAAAAAAVLFVGKPAEPTAPTSIPAPAVAASAPEPAAPSRAAEPETLAASPRPKRAARPARPAPAPQPEMARDEDEVRYFLALDNEPFEIGEVVRVALGPTNVPADVVFSPDGRPRAIRLISFNTQGGR